MAFSPDDLAHMGTAAGYLDLGMPEEAMVELRHVAAAVQNAPEMVVLKVAVYRRMESWEAMEESAKALVGLLPEDVDAWIVWAHAKRKAESIEKGREILLWAEELHPERAILHFSLGCYASQLGFFPEAISRIRRTVDLDDRFKQWAMREPDLGPLWANLGLDRSREMGWPAHF
jgi:tetratricopeptide (TPR) repeat protein